MDGITIGEGNLSGKGVYADKDFIKGEVVIEYHLKPLTLDEFKKLPETEKMFVHTHHGQIYLYSDPERYVNHSLNGNVYQDLEKKCDIALKDIKKGEAITSDATKDDTPLLKKVDAVLVKVPNIDEGLDFYWRQLGQQLRWKTKDTAGLKLGDSELVLSTKLDPETDILVDSVPDAVGLIVKAGGKLIYGPIDIEVGKAAVIEDPFENKLTIVDLSKGLYQVDESGNVTGVK